MSLNLFRKRLFSIENELETKSVSPNLSFPSPFTLFIMFASAFLYTHHHTLWTSFSFLRNKIYGRLFFPPSFFFSLTGGYAHSRYSCIPPFCCGVAANQVCEMEMRTLSLSHSQPPSLSRHQNQAMPPMFFSDLGVLPNLISGAERERERERVGGREWAECRGGAGQKRWKERGWKMYKGERQRERWGQSMGLIQEHLGFFSHYSRDQHNPFFSAEPLLLASGSGSADKMAFCYDAKWKLGSEQGESYLLPSIICSA